MTDIYAQHNKYFRIIPYILIFAACFFIYFKTASYGLSGMIDDDFFIQATFENYSLKDVFTKTVFSNDISSYYRPVLSLSFMLDNFLFNSSPFAFHTTNIFLHSIAAILFFFFLKRYYFKPFLSFLTAVLFAAHPINIFAVAWIPGRNDLLLFIFLILSVIFLLQYIQTKKKYFFLIHSFLFLTSMFTKEIALIFPVLYFLISYTKLSKIKLTKTVILWLSLCVFFLFLHLSVSSKTFTVTHYFNNLINNYKTIFDYYCGVYFFKTHFSAYINAYSFYLGIAAFFMSFIFVYFCKLPKNEKILFFLMPILIVAINLLSGQLFYQASRMYIPLAFILIIFTSFLEQLKNKKIIYFILIILILLSTVLTSSKLKNFKDGLTLLAAVDEEKPNYNTILANLYSYNLLKNGNINKASGKIREIAVITGYKNAYNLYLLAVINIYEGNYQQAINILESIINFDKKDILIKLFICYKYVGNADKSAYYYNQAVELTGTSEITDNLIYRQEEDLKNVKI